MSRFIGAILLIVSSTIGGGIIALPPVSAQGGFVRAVSLMTGVWIVMTLSGLLLAKKSVEREATSIADLAKKSFGKPIQAAVWFVTLTLLYLIAAAYTSGVSTFFANALAQNFSFHVSSPLVAIVFLLIFGGVVSCGIRWIDLATKVLLPIKIGLLLCACALLLPHVAGQNLLAAGSWHRALGAAPYFLCAFGYHCVIPSLCAYTGNSFKRIYAAVITGTTVPFLIYLLWLAVTLGVAPRGEFSSASVFLNTLIDLTGDNYVAVFVRTFTNITMLVSFLAIGLALFDFLRDGLNRQNNYMGRIQTALASFGLPLAFTVFYPDGFLIALRYSSIFATLLMLALPAALNMREKPWPRAIAYLCAGVAIVIICVAIKGL